jgi:hypothetical protein
MKRKVIIIFILPLLLVFASCKKFLDKEPDNRAKLNSPQKVAQLLGSAYPKANYQEMGEVSSDNVGDIGTSGLDVPDWITLDADLYFYRDNKGSGTNEDTPEGYWFGCYKAIAATNLALEAIAQAPNPDDYKAYKGEALVARAYSHFMLVNFFSKFYNEATAGTDPGIPYVTEPETVSIKQYDRKTVQYVYDMAEKDLLEGLPLLDDNVYNVPKFHFNSAAANAFAARFYLYKKDYPKVIQYAKAAVNENAFASNLRPWNTIYAALPLNGNGSLSQVYSKSTENANLLLVETNSWWSISSAQGRFSLTPLIAGNTLSNEPVSGGEWAFQLATQIQQHYIVPKLDLNFVETTIGSGIGDGWQMVPLFTVEEVLFNLAEAYTYSGLPDNAINLLNVYLSTRISQYSPAAHNLTATKIKAHYNASDIKQGLIFTLLDYRRTEFIHEGMRWFDILRYDIQVTHRSLDGTQVILTNDNPHRVFQIPPTAEQSGIPFNPR